MVPSRRESGGWRAEWTRRAAGAACLTAWLAVCACSPSPPNVVLVTFDTTRYDRFGVTGDPEAQTPVVDALAKRGLLFDQHFAPLGLTLPSHTTILSGLEPRAHGVHNNGKFLVPEEVDTLAEILSAAGWETAAFVSAFVLDRRYQLDQGFDHYSDAVEKDAGPLSMMVPQRPASEVTDEALAWLAARSEDSPYFLWAHYYDPHHPRRVEPPFDAIADGYRAEIAYTDAAFGRLLEGVEAAGGRPTLVVFTADHGESLGEHGENTHGLLAYDSTLHVPLVIAGPGVPLGERSSVMGRHADLVPTILPLLGLPVPEGLPGRDLVRAAAADNPGEGVVSGFQSRGVSFDLGWAEIEGIRDARFKFTATPEPVELYDVRTDPGELHDLASEQPEVVTRMRQEYEAYVSSQEPVGAADIGAISSEDLEQLAALGYVEAPAEFEDGARPDPRKFVGVHSWVDAARGLASRGYYPEAIEALETLRESTSVRPLVLRSLAPIYREAGLWDEAVLAYEDYIALTGAREARFGLADVLLRSGRPEDALVALEAAEPSARRAHLRAAALADLGRYDEANRTIASAFRGPRALEQRAHLILRTAPRPDGEEALRSLASQAPDNTRLRSQLGFYLAVWGGPEQRDEALTLLREAAQELTDDPTIQANLGWGAHRLGVPEEAVPALEAATAADPHRYRDRARLGFAQAAAGDPEAARESLRVALAARPNASWSGSARTLLAQLDTPEEDAR